MFHIAVTLLSGQNTSIRVQGETRMDHIKREAQKNLKIGLYASPDSKAMGHGPCLCKFRCMHLCTIKILQDTSHIIHTWFCLTEPNEDLGMGHFTQVSGSCWNTFEALESSTGGRGAFSKPSTSLGYPHVMQQLGRSVCEKDLQLLA